MIERASRSPPSPPTIIGALSSTTLADYMVPWVADDGSGALMLGFGSL